MSNFLIFKAAFNNSATPAIGAYTAEGATASFTQDASLSPDYYLYNPNASITAVQWFVPTKEVTDFEFVADILTDDQALGGDRYFIIADSAGTTGLCMLSSSSITEWRFMNGDNTSTSDPEYVGAIDPATSGGFGVFHRFRVRVRKLTASSSSVEVYVDGTLKLTATAGAALVTCAKIGFIGGVTGSPSTGSGIKNAYVYDLSGGDVIDRGVLSGAFNRFINWAKSIFATKDNVVLRSGGSLMTGSSLGRVDDTGVFQVCGGQTGANGGSISLTGKNRGVSDGAVELTAYDGVDTTGVQILPDGTMTVTYPDTTVKNVAMQEDVVPRSGGAVMTGTELGRIDDTSFMVIRGGTTHTSAYIMCIGISDSTRPGWVRLCPTSNKAMNLKPDGTWTWDGTACQITSDQRYKQQINAIDDKLLDAWEDVELSQFKYNDAVDQKGKDKARLHTGYVVQQIDSACKSHGVDISQYGLYCHEEYPQETEEVEVEQKDGTKTKETKVIREASEHYSLRYTETLVVECKYLRRCIARLTARIEQLEKGKEQEANK